MPFLIDSNALIDVSRGNSGAIDYIDSLKDPWAISQVSSLELIVGARDKQDLDMIDSFLASYEVLPLTESNGHSLMNCCGGMQSHMVCMSSIR